MHKTLKKRSQNPSTMGNSSSKDEEPSKVHGFATPITTDEGGEKGGFPIPTGKEYDTIDKIASEMPGIIDEESREQVNDYIEACNGGKGPMVACFATGEYLSLFERKHNEAADLFRNTCFRPKTDRSPNGVLVDGTKAYPAGCFNLAKMLMTGRGGIQYDRLEGYKAFDRACRGGHGGACYLQAQILCSPEGKLSSGIPYDPHKAMDLLEQTCTNNGDSTSCFKLATMLLRGDKVNEDADNVSPQEANGEVPLEKRENEADRSRKEHEQILKPIERDPKRAEQILLKSCLEGNHVTSCHNLAVMYTNGDDGIPADPQKAEEFQKKTTKMINEFGGYF